MMDEDGEVSWSRLQQVDALEAATLSVNLTEEEERTRARREDRYHSCKDQKFCGKAFLQTDEINIVSNLTVKGSLR